MVVASWLLATAWAMALVPLAKAGISKTPMGPFQTMVLASAISLEKSAMDLGPMSRAMRSAGKAPVAGEDLSFGVGGELVGEDVVDGQEEADAVLFGFGEGGFGDVELVDFDERFAGVLALRVEEGVGHAAADDDGVGFVEEVVDDLDLVGDLGAADDGDEGLEGVGDGFAEVLELLIHEEAGGGLRDEVGDALGGGVGAVGAAEGVVDVEVAEAGELAREVGVVGLLFGMEAEVFEQEGLADFEVAGELGGDGADAVGGEGDVFVEIDDLIEELAEAIDDRAEAHGSDGLALGTAEVGAEDDFGLVAEGVLDGGDGLADAGVVEDLGAVLGEGNVEVDADEDALAVEVEVADRKFGHVRYEDNRRRIRQSVEGGLLRRLRMRSRARVSIWRMRLRRSISSVRMPAGTCASASISTRQVGLRRAATTTMVAAGRMREKNLP